MWAQNALFPAKQNIYLQAIAISSGFLASGLLKQNRSMKASICPYLGALQT